MHLLLSNSEVSGQQIDRYLSSAGIAKELLEVSVPFYTPLLALALVNTINFSHSGRCIEV